MGLDIVELLLRIEEEFDLEIPNGDAEELVTVGLIADYIAQKPEKITGNTRFVQDLDIRLIARFLVV